MLREKASYGSTADRPMVVFTCVDGALRESSAGSCAAARGVLASLSQRGIPVVLTSHHRAADLLQIQRELGCREPVLAEDGRFLYSPRHYFGHLDATLDPTGEWEVVEFSPPSMEEAIELLMWLYRVSGGSPLLIGVGSSWRDHVMLRHVDVPVLIRNPSFDQRRLRLQFPDAYVTASTGIDGWSEALLGVSMAETDVRRDGTRG